MFAVLAIILCCAVIPLVVGILAFLGISKKDKTSANLETTLTPKDGDLWVNVSGAYSRSLSFS